MSRLFENDEVLALAKPAGVSMATSTRAEKTGEAAVRRLLEACGEPPDVDAPVLLVHRLDLGTSGVVLLAKTPEAHRALSRAFQSGEAEKTYRALVWGHPRPAKGSWRESLGRDPRDGRRMRASPGGKRAVTGYETLSRLSSLADLALHPETGRTHQIRVHAAAHGHPIVGDDLYGGASRWHGVRDPTRRAALSRVTRPLLHSARIRVPSLGLDVEAPLPEDYEAVLTALRVLTTEGRRA